MQRGRGAIRTWRCCTAIRNLRSCTRKGCPPAAQRGLTKCERDSSSVSFTETLKATRLFRAEGAAHRAVAFRIDTHCVKIFSRIVQLEDQHLTAGVERTTSSGRSFFHWVFGKEVRNFHDSPGAGESFFDVVALQVNIRIDFVGYAVVTVIALEADIVSGGADPDHLAVDGEGRPPDAQMIARFHDADGFGMCPAIILRSAKKIKLAHGHGEVRLLGETLDEAVEDRTSDIGVHVNPACRGEHLLHGSFGAKNEEVDHVAGIAGLVADAARDLSEEAVVDAGH